MVQIFALFLLFVFSFPAASRADISKEVVSEPVFKGKVFILEGGKSHAETVVLVHGLGDLASGTWHAMLPVLAEKYHVVAFDLPGFGRSEKKNELYSPERYTAFLKWVVEKYVPGPFHLVGHSLGGSVALYFAGTRPENLQNLILANVAGILHRSVITRHFLLPDLEPQWPGSPAVGEKLDHLIDATLLKLEGIPLDPNVLLKNDLLRANILGGDPARIAALALVETDFSTILPRVEVPTLLLWGDKDDITPLRSGILLEGTLKNARLIKIPGAGHMPMFDQANHFNRAIFDFLSSPSGPDSTEALPGNRIGNFSNQDNLILEGHYRSIRLVNCRNARLRGVTAEAIEIIGSTASLEQCFIKGSETGLRIENSTVIGTAVTVEGNIAMEVSRSKLDLAGACLKGKEAALRCGEPSTILFSVSRAESAMSRVYLHGRWEANSQNSL